MHNLFFELIRFSIGTQSSLSRMPSAKEWEQLYAMAQKQSLIGICFAGVKKLCNFEEEYYAGMNEMLYLTWMGMAAKIQQRNETVNKQCAELQARLSADGFRSCILKGQGVGQLYAEHLHGLRQSGDIDLWVDAPMERTVEYVMGIAPTRDVNFQHVHFNVLEDTEVELHMVPVSRYNPRKNRILGRYFDKEIDRQCENRQMVGGYEMSVPTADFQLVHQLLHVYSHYVYEGVGLRQLMDLYFAQWACMDGEQRKEVLALLKKIGMMKYVAGTQWVLRTVFGDGDCLLCEPDEKEGEQMLAEVLEGGNFGHYSEKNKVKDESFGRRMWRRMRQSLRMVRYDLLGIVCAPWYRLRIELWRRRIGRKYHV